MCVMTSLPFYLAFARVRGIGPARLRKLIAVFGSLERAWQADAYALAGAGLDRSLVERLSAARRAMSPQVELERVQASGQNALCWEDASYPALLKSIADPPPVLFVRGTLTPEDAIAIAIVGTRKATPYGRDVARQLAGDLARSGVTIVSGLARGIDAYAHQAALDAGGRSIAVIACGVDRVYPPEHHGLAKRLAERGAVVSDYPPGTAAEPGNFPPRNRIISGLTLGTIVVEAGERSGALITAQFAAEQGRDVFAVPGNIFNASSLGANRLLQQGAIPVTDAQSVLRQLNINAVSEQIGLAESLPATDDERAVLAQLTHEPTSVDELIRTLGKSPHEVNAILAMLELRGVVRMAGQAGYALTRGGR